MNQDRIENCEASTLKEWDRDIAPHLRAVEYASKQAAYFARAVTSAMNVLQRRPGFQTRAYDELRIAHADLTEALTRMRAADNQYVQLEAAE